MYCPKCGYEQKCSCPGPVCKHKDGQLRRNDMAKCFKCGLTRHLDWWTDLEWDIYKDDKTVKGGI